MGILSSFKNFIGTSEPAQEELFEQEQAVAEIPCTDYPVGKYKAYWEKWVDEVPGGFTCKLRYMERVGGGIYGEHYFTEPTMDKLTAAVNAHIVKTMPTWER